MRRSFGRLQRVKTNCHYFLLHYTKQVRHLRYCTAHRVSVRSLNNLVEFTQTQTAHDTLVFLGTSNEAAVVLDPDLLRVAVVVLCPSWHNSPYISSTCLPRKRANSIGSFMRNSASKVARTTLCGFVEPNTLVRTSFTPTACITARTAPPAITPVPSEAGFTSTRPAPYSPIN